MEINKINVRIREATGRGSSRRLRKSGFIPAVVYGKAGSQPLTVDEKEFMALWRKISGGAALVEIEDESGHLRLTQIKEMQRDPIRDFVRHIDFNEVTRGEKMTISVRFHALGQPVGVRSEGGILETPLHELEIRCLPANLPEHLQADVSALKIGDSISIRDLSLPEGVEVLHDPETVVATVLPPVAEEVEVTIAEEIAPGEVPTMREERKAQGEDE